SADVARDPARPYRAHGVVARADDGRREPTRGNWPQHSARKRRNRKTVTWPDRDEEAAGGGDQMIRVGRRHEPDGPTQAQLEAASATFDMLSTPIRLHLMWLLCHAERDVGT